MEKSFSTRSTLENYCIKWKVNQTLYPYYDPSRAKCHLNVGLFYSEVYENPYTGKTMVCSSNNQLFLIFLRYLQCSVKFIRSTEDYGGRFVNNSWNGILSLFERQEADVVGHVFAIVNQREKIIDQEFLMPKQELLSIFSYSKLPLHHENPFRIFECFSTNIWFLIIISLFLCGLLNFFNLYNQERQQEQDQFEDLQRIPKDLIWISHKQHGGLTRSQRRPWWSTLINNYIDMFSIMVGQGDHHHSSSIWRDPLIFWIICSFILRQLFSNDFTAVLLSNMNYKINHFEHLYRLPPSYKIMLEPNSSTGYFFEKLFPKLMKRVEWYSHMDIISIDMLDNLIEEDYVLIINTARAITLKKYYPGTNFHISEEKLMSTLGTYAMRPTLDEENRHRLTKLFRSLYHFGLMLHVDRRLLLNHLRAQSDDVLVHKRTANETAALFRLHTEPKSLSGQTILSFLYIYFIGICCSVSCLLLELFHHKFLSPQMAPPDRFIPQTPILPRSCYS